MRGILILLFSLILYNSCVKEVIIELPSKESKVVVNALLEPDTPPIIHISLSSPINGLANLPVNDATVIISEDGITVDSLQRGLQGIYRFEQIRTKQNSTYRVRVITQSHGITEGEVKIPQSPNIRISSLTTQTNQFDTDGEMNKETSVNLSLVLSDVANQKNYYCVLLTVGRGIDTTVITNYRFDKESNEWIDTLFINSCENLIAWRTSSPLVEYNGGEWNFGFDGSGNVQRVDRSLSAIVGSDMSLGGNAFWFTDEFFDGTLQTLNFSFRAYSSFYCPNYDSEGVEIQPYSVYLFSMSECMYRYCTTAFLSPSDPYAEPVTIYSNITNGYGVVAARSIARSAFIIE